MPEPITPAELDKWEAACNAMPDEEWAAKPDMIEPRWIVEATPGSYVAATLSNDRIYAEFIALARTAMPRLLAERTQLKRIELAARVALETCRASMKPLVRDGVHAQTTNSAAEQFTAAWRDLRNAVEKQETPNDES